VRTPAPSEPAPPANASGADDRSVAAIPSGPPVPDDKPVAAVPPGPSAPVDPKPPAAAAAEAQPAVPQPERAGDPVTIVRSGQAPPAPGTVRRSGGARIIRIDPADGR
jgi:hypothetical protein